jgi:hypothetical protein
MHILAIFFIKNLNVVYIKDHKKKNSKNIFLYLETETDIYYLLLKDEKYCFFLCKYFLYV